MSDSPSVPPTDRIRWVFKGAWLLGVPAHLTIENQTAIITEEPRRG